MKTLNVPILFFFISIFVSVACTGTGAPEDGDLDMAPYSADILPFPTGSGSGNGGLDKCSAADCDTPLNKTVEFSDPAFMSGMRR